MIELSQGLPKLKTVGLYTFRGFNQALNIYFCIPSGGDLYIYLPRACFITVLKAFFNSLNTLLIIRGVYFNKSNQFEVSP